MKITVKTSVPGIHRWKDAPEQVDFLRSHHRHVFNIFLTLNVEHADRELEFFMIKSVIDTYINDKWSNYKNNFNLKFFGDDSCESIATSIKVFIEAEYGTGRKVSVKVQEDDENWGEV